MNPSSAEGIFYYRDVGTNRGDDRSELDTLPQGIIELDKRGTILYYNQAQANLAHRARGSTVGLNFFRDVAPCTAVKEFQGRFNRFADMPGDSFAPFTFLFRFGWEEKRVLITFIRREKAGGDAIYIVVSIPPEE